MELNYDNIILELLNLSIHSVSELSSIAYSLKNTEVAYNDFVANSLRTAINKQNLYNLAVNTEHSVILGSTTARIDINISTINSPDNIIVACEGVRLRQPQRELVKLQIQRVKQYLAINAKGYFLLIYNEATDFETSWKKYLETLNELQLKTENIEEVKATSTVKLIKTNIGKGIPLYHIFINLSHEKEEIVTENRLKYLSISNFKIFKNLSVELSPSINIILGKNAFGKTSFLQALTLANIPDNQRLPYETYINQQSNEAEIMLQRENEAEEKTIINANGKTNENLTKYFHEPVFLAYGTNIFSRYAQHNYVKLIDELLNGTQTWFNVNSIFEEYEISFYDPLGILNTLNDLKDEQANEIKEFMVKCLNKLLPDMLFIDRYPKYQKPYFFCDKNDNYLETIQLSEGYKHNVLLLTDIIVRVITIGSKYYNNLGELFQNIKGIIAIDEFDRHMHPSWQKTYINNIAELLPNIQFILTTHNPVSILGRKDREIQMFHYNENNVIEIKQLPETISVDAGMVLLTHFEMNSILSLELQNKVDDFYTLKTQNTLTEEEKVQLSKLQNTLNDTFIGINIHDFRFLKFLEFLKDKGFNYRERLEELVIDEADIENFRNEFKEYYK